ncbi:MAG: response regulator transcription factor [Flavobacteriia bacterium]|nr:response regulator transcription factor [Flavobacteriia bacterium]
MRAIIVDDVEKVALSLKEMISTYCTDVQLIAIANNADQAEELIGNLKPDIVFLDIHMPGRGGFDLLQSMEKIDFSIIFVSAYNEYAIKAVRFGAIDYILKPVDVSELKEAIERAKEKHSTKKIEIQNLLNNLNKPGDDSNTIIINSERGSSFLKIADIIRIEADGNYSIIFTVSGEKVISSKNLKTFENFLENYSFIRVHHSHVINMKYIKELNKGEQLELVLTNKEIIPISVRKKQGFLERFNKF